MTTAAETIATKKQKDQMRERVAREQRLLSYITKNPGLNGRMLQRVYDDFDVEILSALVESGKIEYVSYEVGTYFRAVREGGWYTTSMTAAEISQHLSEQLERALFGRCKI